MANGKTLVVVESPAKAKTIEKYLGGDYAVRASYGHIRDLGKGYGGLGVDVEHAFTPDYVVPEDSKRHVGELKKVMKAGSGELILATDYDREGEAIAYHVATPARRRPRDGQARDVHRDHPRRDPRGLRTAASDRPEALRRPGGPAHPRPPRGLPHLAAAVEEGPPRPVGGARAVRRGAADRRARARDPCLRAGRVLERRRPAHARGPRAAVHGSAQPGARRQARVRARQEGRAARRRGRRRRARRAAAAGRPTASRTSRRRNASARRRRRSRRRPCSRRPPASSASARARR